MSSDVFISYRRDQVDFARTIQAHLQQARLSVWLDSDELRAEDFGATIQREIQECGTVVVLLTPGYLQRCREDAADYCGKELRWARQYSKKVVLVRQSYEVNISVAEFPTDLAVLARLNALTCAQEYFPEFIRRLVDAVEPLPRPDPASLADAAWAEMSKTLLEPAYQDWQVSRIRRLHPEVGGSALSAVVAMPTIAGREYAVVCYPAASGAVPFEHDLIAPRRPIKRAPNLVSEDSGIELPPWITAQPGGEMRAEYYRLLRDGRRVRRWNMRGFALQGLEIDSGGAVTGCRAVMCTYGENCLSSHLLGFDLYQAFRDERELTYGLRPKLKLGLDGPGGPGEVLALGDWPGFFPLISVQAIVLVAPEAGHGGGWRLLAMERGNRVAAASGFWQFPPAGGFEIYGTESDSDFHVGRQFDLRLALVREFLEEVYGDKDLTCEDPTTASAGMEGLPGFQAAMSALEEGRLVIHFLGVVTELVGLRSEFTFVMIIKDRKLLELRYDVQESPGMRRRAGWLGGSVEAERVHELRLSDALELFDPNYSWNPSSAGAAILFSNLVNDRDSWLCRAYPTLPEFQLPL